VRVAIAAGTQAHPHTHRDNRTVTVLSGTWQMGYGTTFDAKALKTLPPGSVYAEPAGQAHYAQACGSRPWNVYGISVRGFWCICGSRAIF